MKIPLSVMASAALLLAACETYEGGTQDASAGFVKDLPDGVLAIAAPYQDLKSVKIDPTDGCYVYRHVGPVETTLLPLRTTDGRPICTQEPVAPTTG